MSKKVKIWLIVAASLILIGIIIFTVVMTVFGWNFKKLSTVKYETKEYEINESFNNIYIEFGTADIIFLPSEDGKCKVVCYERKNETYNVFVSEDTLTVERSDERKWYEHIALDFNSPEIKIFLPESEYRNLFVSGTTGDVKLSSNFNFESIDISLSTGDVECNANVEGMAKIKLTTGDINVENMTAGAFDLGVTTGDVELERVNCGGEIKIKTTTGDASLEQVNCRSLHTEGTTGAVSLENVIATDSFYIKRGTGNVKLDKCDAGEIFIKTKTGSVKGSLLSEKVFITHSNTGSVKVPDTKNGGTCEIRSNTGSIKITIE